MVDINAKAAHSFGVAFRNALRTAGRATRRDNSGRIETILDRNRHTVQGTVIKTIRPPLVRRNGRTQGPVRIELHDCIQLGIDIFNTLNMGAHQFLAGQVSGPNAMRHLSGGQKTKLAHDCSWRM